MGLDFNNLIQYSTPKFLMVRDWRLGALKYVLMVLVVIKVIILDLFVNCLHLKPQQTRGFGNIDALPPACDKGDKACESAFDSIDELKYCLAYAGTKPVVPEKPKVGDKISPQRLCKYYDEKSLVWIPQERSTLFIPLRNVKKVQKIDPECYDPERDGAMGTATEPGKEKADSRRLKKSRFACRQRYHTVSEEGFFVADVGEFALEFTHSFESKEANLFGAASQFQGFFAACPSNHVKDVRKECLRMKVPGTSGDVVPEDVANLGNASELVPSLGVGPKGGDMIMLNDLLKLTPAAQEFNMTDFVLDRLMPERLQMNGTSMRNHGGMLIVEVDYTNFVKFRPGFPVPSFLEGIFAPIKPITYTYRPFFIPSNTMTRNQVHTSADGQTRTIETWYGLEIRMDFDGKMVKFDWTNVLAALTTGLVLLSVATTATDFIMTNVMPLKDKYKLLKYQTSENFRDCVVLRNNKTSELKSGFPTSDLLLSKLGEDGEPREELTNEELVNVLNSTEIRLSRLDGVDAHTAFTDEPSPPDPRWNNMGNFKRDFYKKMCGGEKCVSLFSDMVQYDEPEGTRKKAPRSEE